jgi:hypothetical protein
MRNSSSGGAALHLGSEYHVRVAAWDFLFELIPDPNLIPPVRPRPIHPAMRIPRGSVHAQVQLEQIFAPLGQL